MDSDFDLDDLSSPPPPPPTSLPPPLPLEFDGGGMLGDVSINDNDDEAMADERDAERDREISSLNKQIYDLEVLLTAKHKELLAKDEEAAARIKQVEEKAMSQVNSIFAAIPVRSGTLESGRFTLRTVSPYSLSLTSPSKPKGHLKENSFSSSSSSSSSSPSSSSSSVSPLSTTIAVHSSSPLSQSLPPGNGTATATTTATPASNLGSSKKSRLSLALSEAKKKAFRGRLMEATHAQPSTVKIQVQDNETDGICTIKGHVRFKDHYTEKPPRVLAWVQRKNLMTLERMPADTITVTSTGFDVAIRHRDPGMMDGAVINWMAVTPPKSCPGLSAAIEAILACPARTVTPELDAVVAAYLHDGNVGDMDSSGQTLLHAAATAGNSRLVKYLLARGARVNAADEHGWTALLCAISPGFLDTALQLIASGADVSVVTESESNALHYLARLSPAGNTDYIPLLTALLKGGCDPSAPNLDGDTPLSTMCQRAQRVDVIEALIRGAAPSSSSQYCANPNTVNNVGMSPLHWAVEKDMTSVISLLLEFGADPELPSPIGTPLEYAEKLHKTFAVTTMRAVITARQEAVEAAAAAAAAASSASVPTTPRGTESPGGSNVTAEGEGDSASATTVGGVIGGNGDSNGGGGGSACEAKALLVDVIEARDLENARDVYCVVKYMEQENHTSIVSQTSNPVWKAQFRVALAKGRATLILQVLNFQMAKSSELLGTVSLSAKGLRPGIVHDKWYHMESFSQTQQGTVHVRLQALPSSSSSSSSSSFSLPLSTSPFGAPSSSPVPTTTLPITIGGTTTECTFPVEPGFSTLPFPHEEWVSSTTATAGCPIDPSCTEEGRYHIEDSASSVTHSASRDVSWDLDVLSAAHPFAALVEPAPYTTVYGFDGEQPLVASVGCGPGPNGLRRVVMRTAGEDLCLALPPQSQKNDVAALVQAIPALAQVKLTSCKSTSPQVLRMLHNYELVNNKSTMKVGIMYAAEGQKTETEILKNCTGSQCFEDFLSFIGDRVELKNFTKYSGGLITKYGPTTKESLYTTYGEKSKLLEIMFHVSTLLRHDENDPQQLDKKRHIGNDVVVVIFKESSGPEDTVDLSSFRSQFNHVFIVVTPIVPQAILQAQSPRPGYSASTSSLPSIPKLLTKYAVYVGCKSAVKPFPPYFPERGNVFDVDNDFRNWLLKKIINGERSAVESPEFKTSKDVARKNMLIAVIEELEK